MSNLDRVSPFMTIQPLKHKVPDGVIVRYFRSMTAWIEDVDVMRTAIVCVDPWKTVAKWSQHLIDTGLYNFQVENLMNTVNDSVIIMVAVERRKDVG